MSTKTHVHIDDLHFDHELWKKELDFYEDEIRIFERRLGEISVRWTDQDVLSQLERFQNQYIREKEVIDILQRDIKRREQALSIYAKEHAENIEDTNFEDHRELRERMFTFRKIYNELKHDFHNFIRKYM